MSPRPLTRFALAVATMLTLGACARDTSLDGWDDASRQVLEGARRAVGGSVDGVVADADAEGPGDPFRTLIHSSRSGLVRMEQSFGFLAGVDVEGPWLWDPRTTAPDSLESFGIGYVHGHELHMKALAPETRFVSGVFAGDTALGDVGVLAIRAKDARGEETVLYYRRNDTLPVGQRVTEPNPNVLITVGDWRDEGGVRVFRSAVFDQGGEIYRYRYRTVTLGAVPDSVFARPPAGAEPVRRIVP